MSTASISKINNICLIILTGVAITTSLIYTRSVLVPFILSLFAYAALAPAVKSLEDFCKISRMLAVLITLFIFFLIMALWTFFVVSSVQVFIQDLDVYKQKLIELINTVTGLLTQYGFSMNREMVDSTLAELPIINIVKKVTGGFFSIFSNSILIGIFVMFLLMGEAKTTVKNKVFNEIKAKISSYILAKFFLSLVTALLTALIVGLSGTGLTLMIATLTFLLNFIPNIGSIIAVMIPVPLLLMHFGLSAPFFLIVILLGLIQFTVGNIIEPKMMGESMDLHPVTILVFLMFWGLIWGIAGMFLAVPITAMIKIVLSRIENTQSWAELLGRGSENVKI